MSLTLAGAKRYVAAVENRPSVPSSAQVIHLLKEAKGQAVASQLQAVAKEIWCVEQALSIQEHYLEAFRSLKNGDFYDAWCQLADAEIELESHERHCVASWKEYRVDFISAHLKQWQSLFPYKLFASAELVHLERRCSICGSPVSIRNPCGHVVGEIYDGELCVRDVTKFLPVAVAMVEKPLQKFCVPFLIDPDTGKQIDHYDYTIVRYVTSLLRGPFDPWRASWTTRRQSHSRFQHVGRNERCPCDSGKKYKKCCLKEDGVLRPHLAIEVESAPPEEVPREVWIGDEKKVRELGGRYGIRLT